VRLIEYVTVESAIFKTGDVVLRWAETGEGCPFVFIHGLGGDLLQPIELMEPLAQIRLIAPDCRAHGESTVGDENLLSFATLADDVLALLDHLSLNRALIGGISMGAGVALRFALCYPDRVSALILSRAAWIDGPMEVRDWFFSVAKHIRQYGAFAGREKFASSDLFLSLANQFPPVAQSLLSLFDSPRSQDGVARLEKLPADAPSISRREWARIEAPVLVLGHSGDPIHPFGHAQVLASNMPNTKLVQITPKWVDHQRHSQDVREATLLFLAGLSEPKN
jgi:pimeloyl-ACP methyl ester carboxylesterase